MPPYLLPVLQITLRHVNATLLLGLWVTPGSSADQNSKTRKEKSQLLQSGESLKKKPHKTPHKIFYAQVFTYLYLQKKDYRGNIHCITSSTMDMQHLGLLVALELFGNSSVVPIVTRAWKAEVLTSSESQNFIIGTSFQPENKHTWRVARHVPFLTSRDNTLYGLSGKDWGPRAPCSKEWLDTPLR